MRKDAKVTVARRMRKALTKPELWLWLRLRDRSQDLVFRNQHPVGPYILDFYCAKAKLCVEVDGVEHTLGERHQRDIERDNWLETKGIHTYRIIARELLADPDATAQGVFDLATERLNGMLPRPPLRGPPSP